LKVYDVRTSDNNKTFEDVRNLLEIRPRERLAYKPPSISILGPPCSGKNQVVDHFAYKYGLIKISLETLLEEETLRDSPLSTKAKEALEKGE